MQITLHQLRVFSVIARTENLTQASESLYLSKGAVSQTLLQLEEYLNTPLFDRVQRRLKLNSQGRQLLPMADEMLTRAQDIEGLFHSSSLSHEVLQIGASQTIGNYILPSLLAQSGHGQQAKVTVANTQDLCQKLLNFEIDMALVEGQNTYADLEEMPWREDEMVLIASPTHPLSTKPVQQLKDLTQQNWVLREPFSGSREQFEKYLRPYIEDIHQIMEFSSLESVMLAVEEGLGISFVSQLAAQARIDANRLVTLALPQKFPRQLFLLHHKRKYLSQALQRFQHSILPPK